MPRKALDLQTKSCLRCGAVIERQRFGNRLEDASAFRRRQFCSLACANTRGNWGDSSTAKHREASKMAKPSCEKCGKLHRWLHVHHLDGDYRNNSPENLQTLCPSCHKLAHSPRSTGFR